MEKFYKWIFICGVQWLWMNILYAETQIQSIEFQVKPGGGSQLKVISDSQVSFQNQYQQAQKQVVIDIDNAHLGKMASRILDTSSFRSPVLMVSPYQLNEGNKKVRIVAQLRANALAKFSQKENTLLVDFESDEEGSEFDFLDEPDSSTEETPSTTETPPLTQAPPATETPSENSQLDPIPDSQIPPPPSQSMATTEATPSSSVPATSQKSSIEEYEDSSKNQNFTGKPITLKVHDSDVRDVLRLIGEASGFNVVIGDGVQGKITLSLEEVPWDQALSVVLNTMKLGAERNNNILRVMTLDSLTQERLSQVKAKAAAERSAPRVTRVFPISYASLSSLKTVLEKFGTSKIAGDATTSDFAAATVEMDDRTNSLIVQDISENLERMAKLIQLLDTQTHQVLIEAKVVEGTEEFISSLTGRLGLSGNAFSSPWGTSINSGVTNLASSDAISSLIGSTATSSQGGVAAAITSEVSLILPGIERVNAFLSMAERENISKTVASPRTVVLNKQTANILSTSPTVQRQVTVNEGVQTVSDNILEANTSLKVTPTVTNDNSVLMDLSVQRDIPQKLTEETGAIAKRSINTKVLVESGSTLVIGGIYDFKKSKNESGFPFLRKIPILGTFFGNEDESETRTELFIFITPKVLNIDSGVANL